MATRDSQLAVQSTVQRRIELSKSLLERMGMTVDQYERVALNALVQNPGLADCDSKTLDLAVMQCIQAGLLPDGKQAAIIPFNNKGVKTATLVPMIEGQLMLFRRAVPGAVYNVKSVYREDEFDYEEGITPILRHKPNPDASRTDADIIAIYARAKLPGAADWEFEVFFRSDVERYRAYSKAPQSPAWVNHWGEQGKKSVGKQLLKRLPKAVGAPPEVPVELDGLDLEDDVAGIINAEQGSYSVRDVDTSTGEIIDAKVVSVDAPQPRQRRPRAQQQPPEPEPMPVDRPGRPDALRVVSGSTAMTAMTRRSRRQHAMSENMFVSAMT